MTRCVQFWRRHSVKSKRQADPGIEHRRVKRPSGQNLEAPVERISDPTIHHKANRTALHILLEQRCNVSPYLDIGIQIQKPLLRNNVREEQAVIWRTPAMEARIFCKRLLR